MSNMKPILFSTAMVQSILEGRKTQTRRIIKPQPIVHNEVIQMPIGIKEYAKELDKYMKKGYTNLYTDGVLSGMMTSKLKYDVGDILWVRETWQHTECLNINPEDENYGFVYKADNGDWENMEGWTWKPSIFMPKEACRIFLKVTEVRAERLEDISEQDAISEGIEVKEHDIAPKGWKDYLFSEIPFDNPKHSFFSLWQSINGEQSRNDNPFVWVVNFERVDIKNTDSIKIK